MADNLNLIKISELIPTTELKSADIIPISQDGETRSIKGAVLEQNLIDKTDARYIENSQKGAPNGVATLGSDSKIPNNQFKLGNVKQLESNVVTGGEVYEFIINKSIINDLFYLKGWISKSSGGFFSDNVRLSTDFLILGDNVLTLKTFIPENVTTIANLALYDKDYKKIITFASNEKIEVNKVDYPDAVYFRMCGDSRYQFETNYKGISPLNKYCQDYKKDIETKLIKGKVEEGNINFVTGGEVYDNILFESVRPTNVNMLNPDDVMLNKTYAPGNNTIINSADYNLVYRFKVEPNTKYSYSPKTSTNEVVRRTHFLRADYSYISDVNAFHDEITTPVDCEYIIFTFRNSLGKDGICVKQGDDKTYSQYNADIIEVLPKGDMTVSSSKSIVNKEYVDSQISKNNGTSFGIKECDKIMWTGSSSTEGYYITKNKLWANKLSDFIDWMFVPYGWSGYNAKRLADTIKADTPCRVANGVKPSEINPTYVVVGKTLNMGTEIAEEFDTTFINDNEYLLSTCLSVIGGKPIISTEYRTDQRQWMENSLKGLADKWGANFIPIGTWCSSYIRNNKFAGFYGQGHPGDRTSDAYTIPLIGYIDKLERPSKSILVFRPRNETEVITNLTYTDNNSRATKWQSIQVGEITMGASYQNMYDRLNESGYTIDNINTSEYMKLLKKQEVSLGSKCLIEVIVPKIKCNISVVLKQVGVSKFYIFDNLSKEFTLVDNLDINDYKYIDFDKVKILLEGSNIKISDIQVNVSGGIEKPKQFYDRINAVRGGTNIVSRGQFKDMSNFNINSNVFYNRLQKYGTEFDDLPLYLDRSTNIVELTDTLTKEITLNNEQSFGYKTLRIWTCSRLNPKIYNPDRFSSHVGNNPFTNINWNNPKNFDFDDLQIVLRYDSVKYPNANQCKSINYTKVGLFWNLNYVDIEVPVVEDGKYYIDITRGSENTSHTLEICDISVDIIN